MLLQRKPCLFPVEERTEIICHQNLLWRLEIVALEPRWLFKEATIWKWPSHETGCCSNNMLVFCMKFLCSSFHLDSSTVQKHKDCGWRTITGCHRGRHQVYGCNSQAATGGAIKYVVATHRRPHGRHHCGSSGNQTAAWTTWNYGWAPSLASHCNFFFFEGVQHPTLQQMALQATTCVA